VILRVLSLTNPHDLRKIMGPKDRRLDTMSSTLNSEFGKLKTKQRQLDRMLDRVRGNNYDRVPKKASRKQRSPKLPENQPSFTEPSGDTGTSP
jgi:hypothetical protein